MSSRRVRRRVMRNYRDDEINDDEEEEEGEGYNASWIVDDDDEEALRSTVSDSDDDVQVIGGEGNDVGVEYSPVHSSAEEESTEEEETVATRSRASRNPDPSRASRTSDPSRTSRNPDPSRSRPSRRSGRGPTRVNGTLSGWLARSGSTAVPSTSSVTDPTVNDSTSVPVTDPASVPVTDSTSRPVTDSTSRPVTDSTSRPENGVSSPPRSGQRRSSNEMEAADSPVKGEKRQRSGASPGGELNSSSTVSEDGSTCTICFEPWTSSDSHRLVSLHCGHLFGKSCIERWFDSIKRPGKPHCPQCKEVGRKRDMRPIFARRLRMMDTSEKERLEGVVKRLEEVAERERKKRIDLEMALMRERERREESEREGMEWKKKLLVMEEKLQQTLSKTRKTIIERTNLPQVQKKKETCSPTKWSQFEMKANLGISQSGSCRVLSCSNNLNLITISEELNHPLLGGHGVRRVSSDEFKKGEFIRIHSKTIKDTSFKPNDALLLSTSFDKTLKLTSLIDRKIVSDIQLEMEGWSCCWDPIRSDSCYVGLKNGTVAEYDVRMPKNGAMNVFASVHPCPLISLQFVSDGRSGKRGSTPPGLLCTSLKSCHFIPLLPIQESFNESVTEVGSNSVTEVGSVAEVGSMAEVGSNLVTEVGSNRSGKDHKILPFTGTFMSGQFDSESGYGLVTSRPSEDKKHVTHYLFDLSLNDDMEPVTKLRRFEGGKSAVKMARSKVFRDRSDFDDTSALLFAADESSGGLKIWDVKSAHVTQVIRSLKPILDIDLLPSSSDHSMTICTLTDSNLAIYTKNNLL